MGLSSKKVKTDQTNKPIYGSQIEGAANAQNAAYQGQIGNIKQTADGFSDLSGDLLDRFRTGDPAITAAKGYITDTLGSDPSSNPHLEDMLSIARDNTRNDLQAKMGTRGQTGGSAYYDMIGRGIHQGEVGARYNDYNQGMQRKAQAAGMAPGVVAGEYIPVAAGMEAGEKGAMLPLQASLLNSAGVGGLLGSYQNIKGTQKQSGGFLGDLLLSGLSAAGSYFGAKG